MPWVVILENSSRADIVAVAGNVYTGGLEADEIEAARLSYLEEIVKS